MKRYVIKPDNKESTKNVFEDWNKRLQEILTIFPSVWLGEYIKWRLWHG